MYPVLHDLLSDRKGGEVFVCFGMWHWCLILLTLAAAALSLLRLGKQNEQGRERALNRWIGLAFGLYIADFFLMPFAYETIDMEKLPFHVCTAACVGCFLSRHWPRLKPWTVPLALLGFVSNLVYLIYPAGVMWHRVHPLSYRVLQTLSFHSVMAVYGLLTLWRYRTEISNGLWKKNLAVICAQTLWAVVGNLLYNGQAGGYDHFFNWFFVVRDPFYVLPETIAPWVMPFANIAVFFTVEMLLCGLISRMRKKGTGE